MRLSVPRIYVRIYAKLKEKTRGKIVRTPDLKSVIRYMIDNRHGIPRSDTSCIIQEMIEMRLIKRLNQRRYRILQHNCIKKLRGFW